MTGRRFERLAVVGYSHNVGKVVFWLCRCDCGKRIAVRGTTLRSGVSGSCGCLNRETSAATHLIHGEAATNEYVIWHGIVRRCTKPGASGYHLYGGRGIDVCDRWRESVVNFIADMGRRPSRLHSVDRIDTNGDYKPENCRWADPIQQGNNRRNNVRLSMGGESHTLSEWSRLIGIGTTTIRERLRRGNPIERVLAPTAPRSR